MVKHRLERLGQLYKADEQVLDMFASTEPLNLAGFAKAYRSEVCDRDEIGVPSK